MDLHARVELFVGVMLVVVGASHLMWPSMWAQLFHDLFEHSWCPLLIGAFTLPLGLAVVATHTLWTLNERVLVTLLGLAWTLKGVFYLLFPGFAIQNYRRIAPGSRHFVIGGAIMLLCGSVILASVLLR